MHTFDSTCLKNAEIFDRCLQGVYIFFNLEIYIFFNLGCDRAFFTNTDIIHITDIKEKFHTQNAQYL